MNPEMMAEFLANNGEKPKREKPSEGRTKRRSKGLKPVSDKQAILNAKWAGIKEGFLFMMARYDPDGPHCQSCGIRGNATTLDLHHLRRRGQGGSYDARNAELLCNRFSKNGPNNCHDRETGQPQWSKESA